ncbi:Zinc finger C2HC domain-containing protein 1A [Frankliniella fusca]|uniref:Zinc finger C2HC domain-containing protein 1A n=1 Tax=Frankliniella fusca TaxID=407009 RepID=A0AAE1HUD0_9NEOP|nr:Zinc finger C2HC domain-containing protein 1A [Frankliniella fusca]
MEISVLPTSTAKGDFKLAFFLNSRFNLIQFLFRITLLFIVWSRLFNTCAKENFLLLFLLPWCHGYFLLLTNESSGQPSCRKQEKMDEVEVECKAGTYPNLDDIVVEDEGPTLLLPCIVCNKTFKPEVLQRHSKVCEKNAHKKRKTFDSFKQRVQGTDLAEFLPFSTVQKKVPHSDKPISPKKASSRWKENHEAFVSAIRAARGEGSDTPGGSGDSRSVLRPPDHEQCPYCERHFGRKAFDRHQEWCREQHSRQPPAPASVQAKERLEARIKYRAPPIKSKRAITREKYSPLVQRKVRQVSPSSSSNYSSATGSATSSAGSSRHTPQSQQEQSNRLSKSGNVTSGRSQSKDSANALGFSRGVVGRSSLRSSQRSAPRPTSPTKQSSGIGKLPASPILRRHSEDSRRVLEKDDIAIASAGLRKLQTRNPLGKHDSKTQDTPKIITEKKNDLCSASTANTPTMHIEINSKQIKDNTNNSKSSKNDLLWSGSYQEEPYDPYASAERQMLELLRSDSACNMSKKQKHESPSPAPSISPMPSPALSPKPSPLETSPTSAFTRYAKELESTETGFQKETYSESPGNPKVNDAINSCGTDDHSTLSEELHKKLSNVPGTQRTELLEESPPDVNQLLPVSKSKSEAPQTVHPVKPQPPPRSNRRLASLPLCNNSIDLVVSGSAMHPLLQSSQSEEAVLKDTESVPYTDFDHRPKTYDLDSKTGKEMIEKGGWFCEKAVFSELDSPIVIDSANGGKIEVLNLENRDDRMRRRETRESREVREITEQESNITDIDNLLEEVVRMQHSVSMLSEVDPSNSKANTMPVNISSARSRRNRAGKMHIEDYLFPAELLERENNNFGTSADTSERSNSVFGSTKSRKSSSKGRRLIEDMLFPQGIDLNANSDYLEDSDVVVSVNALTTMSKPSEELSSKMNAVFSHYPTSPVALTSKAPSVCDNSDSISRPKPMSLSTHSSIRNGCNGGNDKDASSTPMSPMQPLNQSRQSASSRLSADSAYSRSPIPQIRRQGSVGAQDIHRQGAESPQSIISQSLAQSLVLSSSGSESSLPPLSSSLSMKRGNQSKHECVTPSSDIVSATTPLLPKLSKFCHQCGTKFLISVAKFCHECGAARLEIC